MPLPPDWLVQWTQYISLLAGTITAVRALWIGGNYVQWKLNQLKS